VRAAELPGEGIRADRFAPSSEFAPRFLAPKH
jgi:hypothetical protein